MKCFRKIGSWIGDGILLCAAALGCMVLLYGPGWYQMGKTGQLLLHIGVLLGCFTASHMLFGGYRQPRRADGGACLLLMFTTLCGAGLYVFACHELLQRPALAPLPLALMVSLWLLGMLLTRFAAGARKAPVRAAIVGADAVCEQLLRQLRKEGGWKVCCFFAEKSTARRRIRGVKVCRTLEDVPARLAKRDICHVIVAPGALAPQERRPLLRALLAAEGVTVSVLPGDADPSAPLPAQLRPLQLEDLLGRTAAPPDAAAMEDYLTGRVVLVTGGGGSVGSELCRQIAKYRPSKLVVVDNYENGAYALQQELRRVCGKGLNLQIEIASIREEARLRQIFACHRPQVVFHAAAHKHVTLMEQNPQEAVRNNVFGTWHLVRAAEEFGVEKFVLISSDKAVEPTGVMGATKRLCEMILQSRGGQGGATTFAAVRFGNVLESNGSVVPVFRRQIAAGGPVTLMHKDMTRYFMTIEEAAQLVLTAGAMARQNELYVLNMGRPIRILELAEDLIRLHGLRPYQDIKLVEVGLRPGDKMHEKLFLPGSRVEKTGNDRIFIERQPAVTAEALRNKLTLLTIALTADDPAVVKKTLRDVVPGYLP